MAITVWVIKGGDEAGRLNETACVVVVVGAVEVFAAVDV